ncbi:hypothetical protein AX16_008109, partial [Volvariella volvacea WC 439]
MAGTLRKSVHWELNTPRTSDDSSNDSLSIGSADSGPSSSSLDFINSQLVAHGFAASPGLCLDGISGENHDRLIKCLLGLLTQRMEDVSRAEELTTKIRTLSYDFERLSSMYTAATDTAEKAERESHMSKSKVAVADRALQDAVNAHKQSIFELQRTRNNIQGIRAAYQNELRKRDRETDRLLEKWSKISDGQSKLGSAPSGMQCVNSMVTDGATALGGGQGYLDVALEQSEDARNRLAEENARLRTLVVKAVNGISRLEHHAANHDTNGDVVFYTEATLFPLVPSEFTQEKLDTALRQLRQTIDGLAEHQSPLHNTTVPRNGDGMHKVPQDAGAEQLQRPHSELVSSLDQSLRHPSMENQSSTSVYAYSHPVVQDLDYEQLNQHKHTNEEEMLTDHLPPEIEGAQWDDEDMLAPVPQPRSSKRKHRDYPSQSLARSQSPARPKASTRRSVRPTKRFLGSSSKATPAFETEVVQNFQHDSITPRHSLLPTSFVLPPPSPHTAFPTRSALALPISPMDSMEPLQTGSGQEVTIPVEVPVVPASPPETPAPRTFSFAKSFAARIAHPYSPVKPSPLSHVLVAVSPSELDSKEHSITDMDCDEKGQNLPPFELAPSLTMPFAAKPETEPTLTMQSPHPMVQKEGQSNHVAKSEIVQKTFIQPNTRYHTRGKGASTAEKENPRSQKSNSRGMEREPAVSSKKSVSSPAKNGPRRVLMTGNK